jgi:uncharacterized protein YbjT (DUF2867 family)
MLRYLTERLPVMVTPSWEHNRIQPIAIRDVLHYLIALAWDAIPPHTNRAFDIGGPDVLTFGEMTHRYAGGRRAPAPGDHPGPGAHPVAVGPTGSGW